MINLKYILTFLKNSTKILATFKNGGTYLWKQK